MTAGSTGDGLADLRAAVQAQGAGREGSTRVELVGDLCSVLARQVRSDVAATVLTGGVPTALATSPGPRTGDAARLEATAGEGPTYDVHRGRRPVLVPDLAGRGLDRWPGFARAAHEAGITSVFGFPVLVGGAVLGALVLCRRAGGALAAPEVRAGLTAAQVAVDYLLDQRVAPDDDALLHGMVDRQAHVYQAQGMVMAQLGIALDQALARMRAHAFAHGLELGHVATEIVAGRLRLEPDR